MDGPRNYHTKRSKLERERQIPYAITYRRNLKMIQMNLFTKGHETNELIYKRDLQTQKPDLWLPRGRGLEKGWTRSLGLASANYHV